MKQAITDIEQEKTKVAPRRGAWIETPAKIAGKSII